MKQQQNKPLEAPKAPERAPFFLPTLPGVDQRFDFGLGGNGLTDEHAEVKTSKRLDMSAASVETEFVRRLLLEDLSSDCKFSRSDYTHISTLHPNGR
jgi:U3 small nucleolar RNA-associated protein 21